MTRRARSGSHARRYSKAGLPRKLAKKMAHAEVVVHVLAVTAAELVEAIATAVAEVGIAAEMIAGDDVNHIASGGSSTRPYFC